MKMNSYQAIKEYIFNKLRKSEGPLPYNIIEQEIEDAKVIFTSVGPEMGAKILSIESLNLLLPQDWQRMQRELETHFDVKLENGVLIQGEEQQERDNTWWTSIQKQKGSNYYWNRYNDFLKKILPPEVIKTLDIDTDVVMNNLENPSSSTFSRYGMVVGHVQSGKTGNYSALVCKAADAGYKFIVIIAGGINNLRNQTQARLNESFVGQTKGMQIGSGKGNTDKKTLPLSLTTVERDFNKQDADRLSQGLNFDNISVPILLVIKKHSKTLDNVIDWLEKQYKNRVAKHAMLVIDDESDYASINTKEKEDPTAINKKLRKLLSLFQKSAYVAYTATPYANIFIDHKAENEDLGRDLFPKDFIYVLETPTNYFGARKIFLDSDEMHLVPIDDFGNDLPLDHKKELTISNLPSSLFDAIRLFCLNISIRSLRSNDSSHNSMLIHATRFTDVHRLLATHVEEYLKAIKIDVNVYGNLPDAQKQSQIIGDLNETLNRRLRNIEFGWEEILKRLSHLADSIIVREVHQKASISLEYRSDIATNAIVIGGTSLSRGYTLEGLSVSYFLRNTFFYDTLMQMGRWFGYRTGYEDLCRIYISQDKINDFADIITATEELFRDFRLMAEEKLTPNDFGLAVQENPDSALQVTARNKQKNVREFIFSMRLDGKAKETSQLSKVPDEITFNIDVIKSFVSNLGKNYEPVGSGGGSFLWRDINKSYVQSFLRNFKTYKNDPLGLTSRMPIAFIQKYADERDINWDVVLYGGQGPGFKITDSITIKKELRKVTVKDNCYEVKNRQVSSGNAEAIVFDREKRGTIGSDRSEARSQMVRPLLMLHILHPEFDPIQNKPDALAAFGVSCPGNVLSNEGTIRLKINTVYYDNLLKEIENENESDD